MLQMRGLPAIPSTADVHPRTNTTADAASCTRRSEAQLATFAKSQDLSPGQRSHAARAMEGADLRCRCSHQPLSNGREADNVALRYALTNVCFEQVSECQLAVDLQFHFAKFASRTPHGNVFLWSAPVRKAPRPAYQLGDFRTFKTINAKGFDSFGLYWCCRRIDRISAETGANDHTGRPSTRGLRD